MLSIIITPSEQEYISISGVPINYSCTLFEETVDPNKIGYLDSYNSMQEILEKKSTINETICLYVTHIDVIALGAISSFMNFVPNRTKIIEKASKRILHVWITDLMGHDCNLYGIFQHTYTYDHHSGFYYGRTISRIDLEMDQPDGLHVH